METINTARKRSISEVLGEAALEEEGRQCPSRHTRHVNLVRQAVSSDIIFSVNTAKAFLQPERPSVELLSDTSGSDASVQTVRVYPGSVDWMRDPHRNPATVRRAILQQTLADSG